MPDMVQVGNEITNGMLWPDGGSSSGANYDNLATLVKAGIAAVKEVDPSILVMEHIDRGGDNAGARAWLDAMFARGVTFDIIGLSYYPQYQGTLAQLTSNVNDLASRYGKPIVAAEYSQSKREVNDAIHALPNGLGKGTFIWEPTSYGEPFFNSSGATIPSLIDLYPQMYTAYGITP
jgi:beta-galactosidase/arabinogalactan endo-1,4-beta-galactosidase